MRRVFRSLSLVFAMVLLLGVTTGARADLIPPAQNLFGMTLGDWSAAWWQWVLAIPAANNPAADASGAKCGVDQGSGPVFFLTGNFTSAATLDRTECQVPAGRTLVFPIINTECSTLEAAPFYGANEKELRACAAASMDGINPATLVLTVDGVAVPNLYQLRAQSPVFTFHLPANNIIALKTGKKVGISGNSGMSVSDGIWAMLQPLPPGPHTIHFAGAIQSGPTPYSVDVTYHLTVLQ